MLYRVSFNASNASYSRCFTDRSKAEKFYNDLLHSGIYRNISFQEGWSYRWPIGVTGASIKLFIAVLSAWRAKSYIFPSIFKEWNFTPWGSQENHIISQEDKTMKHTDPQPLMTYSQWCTIFKYRLKKYIRRKLYNGLQWLLFILFMVGIPYGMIVHWLFFGY